MKTALQSWRESRSLNLAVNDPRAWHEVGGVSTATGLEVTHDSALSLSGLYAAVKNSSEDLAALPLHAFERLENGGKTRAQGVKAEELLYWSPNPFMTGQEFREAMLGQVELRGNAYAEIERDGYGQPVRLWPLRADRVSPFIGKDGNLFYAVNFNGTIFGNKAYVLPARLVLHLHGFGSNGIMGWDPVALHRENIAHGLAVQEYGARFFGNNSMPGGVLEYPEKLSPEAKDNLRKSWEYGNRGLSQSHRVALLEFGVTWKQVGLAPEAAQFIQSRKLSISEAARIWRYPPHMLADLEKASFSNITQQALEYVTYSLLPRAKRIEGRIWLSLLPPGTAGRYFLEHNFAGLLRGDLDSRYKAYATGRQWGWLSVNDVRRLENMNPIDGGDRYLEPLNMVEAGAELPSQEEARKLVSLQGLDLPEKRQANEKRSPDRRLALRDEYRPKFEAVAGEAVAEEVDGLRSLAARELRSVASFSSALEEFWDVREEQILEDFRGLVSSYARDVAEAAAAEIGKEAPALDQFVSLYLERLASTWVRSSRGQVEDLLEEGGEDALELLEERLDSWEDSRADQFGRNEATKGLGAFSRKAWILLGVTRFRWRTVGKNCPSCGSLDGAVVGRNVAFVPAGESISAGDQSPITSRRGTLHPPLHKGCDCIILAD